jgi:hypothetical protein
MPSPHASTPAAQPDTGAPAEECARCHYFLAAPMDKMVATFCRRYPPQLVVIMSGPPPKQMLIGNPHAPQTMHQPQPMFPNVGMNDWCGEFVARRGA